MSQDTTFSEVVEDLKEGIQRSALKACFGGVGLFLNRLLDVDADAEVGEPVRLMSVSRTIQAARARTDEALNDAFLRDGRVELYVAEERERTDQIAQQLLQRLVRVRYAVSRGELGEAERLLQGLHEDTQGFQSIEDIEEEGA